MVSVPKFPPIPRLSIVVPIGQDLLAFESTLISILENRPPACEVLVSHDGSYDDPFGICDEVSFTTSTSNRMVDLVSAGVCRSRGRFVHVLADGIRATDGWTDLALEKFEHQDAGLVTPVIRSDRSGRIIAAGWCDRAAGLCQTAASGRDDVDPRSATSCGGSYLQASFWRRELIQSLCDAFDGCDCSVEASYAFGHLIRESGWRNVVASECTLVSDHETLPWENSSLRRGKRLRAIQSAFNPCGWSKSLGYAAKALLANALRPTKYAESIGQALAPLSAANITALSRNARLPGYDRAEVIVRMPSHSHHRARWAA